MSSDIFVSTCTDGVKCHHRCGGREDCFRLDGKVEDLISDLFGEPDTNISLTNAMSYQELLSELAEARRDRFPDLELFARELGWAPADVRAFERLGSDPRISSVRQIANALGVEIAHRTVHAYTDPDLEELRAALEPVGSVTVESVETPSDQLTVFPVKLKRVVKGFDAEWIDSLFVDHAGRIYEFSADIFHRLDDDATYRSADTQ